jgi:hypothetical protein
MLSALLMLQRVVKAFRYAVREEDLLDVFGAGMVFVVAGTLAYALGSGWNVVDALYFAVATLPTTSVADPDLVLEDGWLKVFTVLYQLIGIGILVEILRRLGIAFVAVRQAERRGPAATCRRERGPPPPEQCAHPPGWRGEGRGATSSAAAPRRPRRARALPPLRGR